MEVLELGTLRPCLCGQEQDERQMLVVEQCDSDGYYIKCDSCGACGPVGYPGEEYDGCDYEACDKATEEAKAKSIGLWNELWEGRECLRAENAALKAQIAEAAKGPISLDAVLVADSYQAEIDALTERNRKLEVVRDEAKDTADLFYTFGGITLEQMDSLREALRAAEEEA